MMEKVLPTKSGVVKRSQGKPALFVCSSLPSRPGWRDRNSVGILGLYCIRFVGEYAEIKMIVLAGYGQPIQPRIADHVVELRSELGQKYGVGAAKHAPGQPGYAQFPPGGHQPARPKICRQ